MKVAPNKNFVTKTFSESRCERLCKTTKAKTGKNNNNNKCNIQSSY